MTDKEKKALKAKIFHYFAGEHGLTLLDSELEEVVGFFAEADPTLRASERLCQIYFNIASDVLGEEKVRKLRDETIKAN